MWKSLQTPAAKRREDEIRDINRVRAIRISIASPDQVRSWSYGEVKNPETIDYKTYKPKNDGLFCERIFGPTRDYECSCGKFKGIKHRGVVCDRCGVEVTQSKVRRSRLGHIDLEMPVAHIWYSKGVPSLMALLLDLSVKALERVLYYEEYIVLDPGSTELNPMDIISEREYARLREEYGADFKVGMGAEAVREILAKLELDALANELRISIREGKSKQRVKRNIKRLKIVEDFRASSNRPEWMIMEILPVIPPDLRPLVPLDGGRFATSDLNDLYRRVINRNNRLRRLKEVRAPEVIIRNEKRMLQEAVDALLDNGRRGRPVKGSNNRPLKSLSDMLKGKQGRFRQNLLGKRVDYSGRSVIVCGPDLKFNECGLPKQMALELFEPFIIRRLEELDEVTTIRSAKRKIERQDPEVFDVLEEVIHNHPVLLNRAPTLHRMGIQAFQPKLVEGKAIRLHPLTCAAFNADFDGDQMAVHVPLSSEAQKECNEQMLAINNILGPSDGRPIATPSQDIVLGCYYLTKIRFPIDKNEPKRFSDSREAIIAYDNGAVDLLEEIEVRIDGTRMRTTVGRILFNDILPPELRFVNKTMNKKALSMLVSSCFNTCGRDRTAQFLDDIKNAGYYYAKLGGISIGLTDMIVPESKKKLLDNARNDVQAIIQQFEKGAITDIERYNKVIDRWINTTDAVAESMMEVLEKDNLGFNPIYIMADSGARGSKQQIRQLAGMRGLMSKPMKKLTGGIGEIIESPIESNFKEGLSVLEYFISTHGARKGLADTALKTAEAGYLTRRLVDVAQDVIITEDDCGALSGLEVRSIKEGDHVIEALQDRVIGRVAAEDILNPLTGKLIVKRGQVIDEEAASLIGKCGLERVFIRSVVACESPRGVCAKCYGWDLSRRSMIRIGEAVGVVAAQSIGEPGTQLTLRTFHIGGTTSRIIEESEIRLRRNEDGMAGLRDGESGIIMYINLRSVLNRHGERIAVNSVGRPVLIRSGIEAPDLKGKSDPLVKFDQIEYVESGKNMIVTKSGGSLCLTNTRGKELMRYYNIPIGAVLFVKEGDRCAPGSP
ncbi:MAG: DNA-directed RNA polymerase subunit beta', partial [Candidatus Hinthialibacter sp.]